MSDTAVVEISAPAKVTAKDVAKAAARVLRLRRRLSEAERSVEYFCEQRDSLRAELNTAADVLNGLTELLARVE